MATVANTGFGRPKTARSGLYAGVGWGVNVIDSVRSEFNGGAIIDALIVSRKAKSPRTKESQDLYSLSMQGHVDRSSTWLLGSG